MNTGCSPAELTTSLSSLNNQQQEAVRRIISAKDYVLLLGMPGTGKSSTLAFAIRSLVSKGHRVLITSYTHSAVDTLVTKLKDSGMDQSTILRLGSATSIKENLHHLILDHSKLGNTLKLKERLDQARVVACTVLAASSDSIISKIEFDYCIVDEAGQITQPAAVGALLLSKRFVLVGDDYQLPPLIISSEAQSNGMDVSLFKRLAEAHPQAVVTLSAQYRMNAEIMEVSNCLVYDRRLICGTDAVARGRLFLPHISPQLPAWLAQCIDPAWPVLFLNTDKLTTMESSPTLESFNGSVDSSRGSVVNLSEVEVVKILCRAFVQAGMPMQNLGVVSPYRSQVTAIKAALLTEEQACTCDVSTVDKFQGRDMDAMVLSLVRSNAHGAVGNLLRDWRRVNVAMTRAKFKLLIIGSLSILENVPILRELAKLVKERNYVVDIPSSVSKLAAAE